MNDVSHLLKLIDAYLDGAPGTKEVTVSFWVFNDSKKIAAMRAGADITVGRYNYAIRWLAANWPAGAVWPASVARPETVQAA